MTGESNKIIYSKFTFKHWFCIYEKVDGTWWLWSL